MELYNEKTSKKVFLKHTFPQNFINCNTLVYRDDHLKNGSKYNLVLNIIYNYWWACVY